MYNFNNQYNNYQKPHSNLDWIMVQNTNQVEQVQVQPGQKAWVMVQNEPIFALRVADQMGLVNTDYYKFEKYDPNQSQNNYVTVEQMNQTIAQAIEQLKGAMNEPIS